MITRHQLRAGRVLIGLHQHELARMAEVPVETVRALERGTFPRPSDRMLERLHRVLVNAGVEFGPHGWLRHSNDGRPDAEPPPCNDYQRALELAIADLERGQWRGGQMLARVLRVCLDSDSVAYALIFDALRSGLYAVIARDMSDGLLVNSQVDASCGNHDYPDTLKVTIYTVGGLQVMRALRVLGDDLLEGLDYRPIGPVPPIPPSGGWNKSYNRIRNIVEAPLQADSQRVRQVSADLEEILLEDE